jgi:hypothetical protein
MNNLIDKLKQKKNPKKKQNFQFVIGNVSQLNKKDENVLEDVNANDEKINPRPVILVDKRKNFNVDRNLVLSKLNKKTNFGIVANKTKITTENRPNYSFTPLTPISPLTNSSFSVEEEIPEAPIQSENEVQNIRENTTVPPLPPKKQKKRIIIQEDTAEPKTAVSRIPAAVIEPIEPKNIEAIADEDEDLDLNFEEIVPQPGPLTVPPPAKKRGRPRKNPIPEPPPIAGPAEEKPKRKTQKKKPILPINAAATVPAEIINLDKVKIGRKLLVNRLPKKETFVLKTSNYYLNNRKMFIQKTAALFNKYKKDIKDDVLRRDKSTLYIHQEIVRDYLNILSPYRGLLLYHGLGSGKTCASIAIAEGMKTQKHIILLVPASLKTNFYNDIKKCGDELYKKIQYWEFISIDGHDEYVSIFSNVLQIPKEYILKKRGAWLVDVSKKEENYTSLNPTQQREINEQLNVMIETKYSYLNYVGGITNRVFQEITQNETVNPFDNKTVIIEESHNFVSRIVNKINSGNKTSISLKLYHYLMSATNVKIVFLSGTPIINYPNELAVMFNILRGYIKTWTFQLSLGKNAPPGFKLNKEELIKLFEKDGLKTFDYIEFSGNKMTITKNPYGFINSGTITSGKYEGVSLDETGNIGDDDFLRVIEQILKKNNISIAKSTTGGVSYKENICLPDILEEFLDIFIGSNNSLQKLNVFKKRILGLTSYFKSASEKLLPFLIKDESAAADSSVSAYYIENIEMSPYQFEAYEKIRKEEADSEKAKKVKRAQVAKKGEDFLISSTYRIFSRTVCNFAFPKPPGRPMPTKKGENQVLDENEDIEAIEEQNVNNVGEEEDVANAAVPPNYQQKIKSALLYLKTNSEELLSSENLSQYSPKFKKILDNITDPQNTGLHLLYSQFRVLEGIGIFKLVLEANGFAEFKINKKTNGEWEIIYNEEDAGKPRFVLYTGTETVEEKEIIRNIYNSNWDILPRYIYSQLVEISTNNFYGEIIKVFMITSSGTEGINLKNTRFVHIMEPYWNMVRLEQVVGRARRIESHIDLPEEERTVKSFLYISTFSNQQRTNDRNIEMMIRDTSRFVKNKSITTDDYLFEIAQSKYNINNAFLKAIKETAVDCSLYNSKNKDENLICYNFGNITSNAFSSYPDIEMDKGEIDNTGKTKTLKLKLTKEINGVRYAVDMDTMIVYDLESYEQAKQGKGDLLPVGKIEENRVILD